CLNGWDALLAAPVAGPVCAFCAWKLTPWFARARVRRLAHRSRARQQKAGGGAIVGRSGPDLAMQRYVNWYVWGHARWEHGPLWRTFLAEQRALVREAEDLALLAPGICAPTLLLADPEDSLVPFRTAQTLARLLPDAVLHPVEDAGHHLPLRAADRVAGEIVAFLGCLAGHHPSTGSSQANAWRDSGESS
ncbi:MAG TPA: alpha/beta hydrolase, partial [Streptosporangiaceae bacterium]